MKQKTLKTGVKITYDKKGNIKNLVYPYDKDLNINKPIK